MEHKYIFDNTIIHRLNDFQNNHLYIKREDLLPFSFGGNKVRIAIEYIKDMKRKNCDVIIGYGNSRSNLCRVLANIACKENIPCYIISPSDDDGIRFETNNSYLSNISGAKYVYCNKANVSETIKKLITRLKVDGRSPYYINGDEYGQGNEAIPVNAYFNVYNEIINQEKFLNLHFDYIFLALGTGMTYAGLISGQIYANDLKKKIIGISIARKQKTALLHVKKYIHSYFDNINNRDILNCVNIIDNYLFGGYGKYSDDLKLEIISLYKEEGIYADLTYVGKAFYGMKKYIEKKDISNKNILFIHTGSSPLFFDKINEILGD